jgi:ABC-2 type transport system permease protein
VTAAASQPGEAVAAPDAGVPAGNIYDLGYRRYAGPRLGRRHAVRALYLFSLRGTFGIGRSGRSKIAPFALAVLTLLPALVAVGIAALTSQAGAPSGVESPIRYATYLAFSETLLILFCAAQSPELVGRDQRYSVLPLYFSRALRRSDYALAKLGAIWTAIAVIALAPQVVIFLGRVLASNDVPAALADNLPAVPPILAITAVVALSLGSLSLAIASFTPRRAYATAGIIALFIVPTIVASIVAELGGGSLTMIATLFDPTDLLDGANGWLFDRNPGNDVLAAANLPSAAFVPILAAWTVLAVVAIVARYRRISA